MNDPDSPGGKPLESPTQGRRSDREVCGHESDEPIDAEIIDAEVVPDPPWTPDHWKQSSRATLPPPKEITYHVPERFGMSATLGITTALALLFGMLRRLNAPEVTYLFFGTLAMVICVVQMRFGDLPRQASVIAGAILLPIFLIGYAMFIDFPRRGEDFACFVVGAMPVGAFLGYITGTCAGGIFLLMALFEKYWTRHAVPTRLDGLSKHG
jgi:hypothetical protein